MCTTFLSKVHFLIQQKVKYPSKYFQLNRITNILYCYFRQHFIDICNGKVIGHPMMIMKDPSLKKTGAKGEYLINKVKFSTQIQNKPIISKNM